MIAVATIAFAGCKKDDDMPVLPDIYEIDDAPLYAASNKVWIFGNQTWSDAIQIPECKKTSFENSYTGQQCRNSTSGTNMWYYYNWSYVNTNKDSLCPSPWRVPLVEDFRTLMNNTNSKTLAISWGYGGLADSTSVNNTGSDALYWSSIESSTRRAYSLYFGTGNGVAGLQDSTYKRNGFQVRCVK
jgi:hypothetical protein